MTQDTALVDISHEILIAIQARDRASLERLLREDFVHIDEAGSRYGRAQFVAAIEGADYRIERLSFDSLSVEIVGDTAIVCGVQRGAVLLGGGQRVEGRTAFTDLFLRDASGWRLRLAASAELS
jgi:ketosteroid isomerase-like protein